MWLCLVLSLAISMFLSIAVHSSLLQNQKTTLKHGKTKKMNTWPVQFTRKCNWTRSRYYIHHVGLCSEKHQGLVQIFKNCWLQEVIWCPICKRGELQENQSFISCSLCKLQLKKGDEVWQFSFLSFSLNRKICCALVFYNFTEHVACNLVFYLFCVFLR